MNTTDRSRFALYVTFTSALALAVRWVAAWFAYPTPRDASHFIQHAIELAHGNPDAWSSYWSQGMILVATAAIRLGIDSHLTLQSLAVLSGVGVVIFTMYIARHLLEDVWPAVLAGLLVATLPSVVTYSAIGLSEMPYAMSALGAVYFVLRALDAPVGRQTWIWMIPAAPFLAIAYYFKGADALVLSAALGLYALLFKREMLVRKIPVCVAGVVLVALLILPLFLLTYKETGQFMPGSKVSNLAMGREGTRSEAIYGLDQEWRQGAAYLQEHGTLRYLIKYRTEVTKRVVLNAADAVRIFNDILFTKTMRAGAGWFALFLITMAALLVRHPKWRALCLPALCFAAQLAAMSLFFYRLRTLIPITPFLVILISAGLHVFYRGCARGTARAALMAALALFVGANTLHASSILVREAAWWNEYNQRTVARMLKQYGGDELVIMTFGSLMSVYHYEQYPLRTREIPFASLDRIEEAAARGDVDLIVVSDQRRPHWPISEVFQPKAKLPPTWQIVDLIELKSENWRVPTERYMIIRRQKASTADEPSTGAGPDGES